MGKLQKSANFVGVAFGVAVIANGPALAHNILLPADPPHETAFYGVAASGASHYVETSDNGTGSIIQVVRPSGHEIVAEVSAAPS